MLERWPVGGPLVFLLASLSACDASVPSDPRSYSRGYSSPEVAAPLPPGSPPPPGGALDATTYGATPGQDSRTAIQGALDAAGLGGAVTLPPAGLPYLLTSAGPNPLNAGGQYALRIPAGVTLHIAAGATLQLADGQQTDAGGPVDLIVWDADDVTITGGGTIRGNTAGQPWTGGYQQITAGCLVRSFRPARGAVVSDLHLVDAFSNPVNLEGEGPVAISRIRSADVGEGPQVIGVRGVTMEDIYHSDDADVSVGDAVEVSHVLDFTIGRVLVTAGASGAGGAGIDVFGSSQGVVEDVRMEGQNYGIELHDSWVAPFPITDDVVVRRVMLAGSRVMGLISGAGSRGSVRYEDVEVRGAGIGAWVDGPAGLPPLTLHRVAFVGCNQGLVVRGSRAVVAVHGHAVGSVVDGVNVQGDTPSITLRRFASRGNGRHGVHLDAPGASVLIEGGSFLGNGGQPYSGLPPGAVVVATTPAP